MLFPQIKWAVLRHVLPNEQGPFWNKRITILKNKRNKDIKTYVSEYTINWALSIEMEPRSRNEGEKEKEIKHIWKGGNLRYKSHRFTYRSALAPFRLWNSTIFTHMDANALNIRYERQRRCTEHSTNTAIATATNYSNNCKYRRHHHQHQQKQKQYRIVWQSILNLYTVQRFPCSQRRTRKEKKNLALQNMSPTWNDIFRMGESGEHRRAWQLEWWWVKVSGFKRRTMSIEEQWAMK